MKAFENVKNKKGQRRKKENKRKRERKERKGTESTPPPPPPPPLPHQFGFYEYDSWTIRRALAFFLLDINNTTLAGSPKKLVALCRGKREN